LKVNRYVLATSRLTAGFEYVGPAMPADRARAILAA
jgi:hypothetical protein